MAAPEYLNNLQIGDVLERIGGVEQGQNIPYWIVENIYTDDDNNKSVSLRKYDINNRTASSEGVFKTAAQLATDFTFIRHDDLPTGGRRKRRSRKSRRSKKRSRRNRRSRRH
jgi:hypothetical protein